MRIQQIPPAVLKKARGLTETEITPRLVKPGWRSLGYTSTECPDVFVDALQPRTIVRFEIEPNQGNPTKGRIKIWFEKGWALIRWPVNGMLKAELWSTKPAVKPPTWSFNHPYEYTSSQVKALMEKTGLTEQQVETALAQVGPKYAELSLELAKWLSKKLKAPTFAVYRDEMCKLWHQLNHIRPVFDRRLMKNPVISCSSPDIRVVMWGAKCVALS